MTAIPGRRGVNAALLLLSVAPPVAAQSRAPLTGRTTIEPPAMTDILVLENGRIWTNDPDRPEARGLVIQGDRIAIVITDENAVPLDETPHTRRIDLGGRRVVPGFNDAHTHFIEGGFALLAPDLVTSDTPEELVRRLAEYAAGLPAGRWIDLAAAWDHQRWPGHPLPSRALIDSVTPDNPVWIRRPDGHIGLANSRALELAGITRETPDPPGGQIDRDPGTGEPTGILRDASELIAAAIPPVSEEAIREALESALAHAARLGVTSVQDMCYDYGPGAIRLLQEHARAGTLTARVYCRTSLDDWENAASMGVTAGYGDAWVRVGSLKEFADGALGSSTAYMFEPYADDPENRGLLGAVMQPTDTFFARAAGADRAHLQLSIHAIGDAAISLVLDQLEKIRDENPVWDRRWRIEHAQHMARKDFARMAELGAIASVQPYHAIDDGRWAERKIGPERARTTYAFRSFLDAGVPLALGTDWPVAPLDPWATIYAAVTRRTLAGAHPGGWVPEEKIALEEALRAYTSGSAHAEFAEGEKGRLAPEYYADLVVLSEDPFVVAPERLGQIESVLTIVGGRVVYSALAGEEE
ncbi:MAG TPA: amidohydrolase [Gemmatimonadota bacterium]|nr:amidohydrolase [Gemmatimonadota bacterium]